VGLLREGNAGSNTGADHVKVVDAAISQLPADIWEAALDPDGKPRTDVHVAELTGLLRASARPVEPARPPAPGHARPPRRRSTRCQPTPSGDHATPAKTRRWIWPGPTRCGGNARP